MVWLFRLNCRFALPWMMPVLSSWTCETFTSGAYGIANDVTSLMPVVCICPAMKPLTATISANCWNVDCVNW